MRLTMFRESADGPVSMRRVLSFYFALMAFPLGLIPLSSDGITWGYFIPCGLCIGASLVLLFFTTWADVASVISSAKGNK